MSLILEALRKSEAERRRGEAPDLFQPDVAARTTASPSPRPWLWAAPVLLLLPLLYWWPRAPNRGSNVVAVPVQAPVAADASTDAAPAPAVLPEVRRLRPPRATPIPAPPAEARTIAPAVVADPGPVPLGALPRERREALPPLQLSMHLWNEDPERRVAILDGRRVTVGDRVGEAVVAEIRRDGVLLAWQGGQVLVPLP